MTGPEKRDPRAIMVALAAVMVAASKQDREHSAKVCDLSLVMHQLAQVEAVFTTSRQWLMQRSSSCWLAVSGRSFANAGA
ncbi:exported hypothetical protein [Nitrolancea hollandica Lb]|uniref:Uncharacterized protein n=1 Tax=Nitrolancea hollandica Lb TaxID=1129897 RepID=I4EDY0_9BACT|nr:exported hypothetical protein [Nitrolancea hollandica Lb]